MPPKPIYRGQGNQPFQIARPDGPVQRGQTVPYDVNGAPSGGSADAITTTKVAGAALGGHRAVYIANDGKAYYASPTSHARQCAGITTGAASAGADATIQTDGEIEEASWTWNDSEVIWLAPNGMLTQTVPTSDMAFQVGVPTGPTKMRIEPQLIAQLA